MMEIKVAAVKAVRKRKGKAIRNLKGATPVDTGYARSRWEAKDTIYGFDVENDAEYISDLNDGSSQQAPAMFIERELSSIGKVLP